MHFFPTGLVHESAGKKLLGLVSDNSYNLLYVSVRSTLISKETVQFNMQLSATVLYFNSFHLMF